MATKLESEKREMIVNFTVNEDGKIEAEVRGYVRKNEVVLIIEQEHDGRWVCRVHDQCDPRRNLPEHPSRWRRTKFGVEADGTELSRFPLIVGTFCGPLFPSSEALSTMFDNYAVASDDLRDIPYSKTYADIVGAWILDELSDDDWLFLNQYNWGRE